MLIMPGPTLKTETSSNQENQKKNNTILVNNFNETTVKNFREEFQKLDEDVDVPLIVIYIDSYGGVIYSLLAMIDIIDGRSSKKPVATIALGKAMSCGAVLLTCGTKGYRFAGKNSSLMIHEVSSMNFGSLTELKNNLKEVERLNDVIFKILETNCNQKSGYFRKLIKNNDQADLYLTASQGKKHRLIDYVGVPKISFNTNIKLSV